MLKLAAIVIGVIVAVLILIWVVFVRGERRLMAIDDDCAAHARRAIEPGEAPRV